MSDKTIYEGNLGYVPGPMVRSTKNNPPEKGGAEAKMVEDFKQTESQESSDTGEFLSDYEAWLAAK